MDNRYVIDFYDMIDGWIGSWEIRSEYNFGNDLEKAKAKCIELQNKLSISNRKAGEHYGVIDRTKGIEIFCGKNLPIKADDKCWRTKHEKICPYNKSIECRGALDNCKPIILYNSDDILVLLNKVK